MHREALVRSVCGATALSVAVLTLIVGSAAAQTPALDSRAVNARHQLTATTVARLRQRADVKALGLTPIQVEAFTAALLDDRLALLEDRVDPGEAARRMAGLQKDQDATYELVEAWTRSQRLSTALAAQKPDERQRTITALNVIALTSRAYAAMARTEPTTVGGRIASASGRARAKQLAAAALALGPESPDAHYLMGDLWFEEERPVEAEAEYRLALQQQPRSSAGRTKLAAALRYQGKMSDAIAELREVQRADPAFARAHSDLGLILRSQKDLPEAIAAYREAIRLDPDSTDAHNGLAVALVNSGKPLEALAEFREIVRVDPDSTIGYYNLAYLLADLDRDVEAAAALREVIRINPNHYNARFNLGELFRLEGKYDDAASQFREYLRLAPDTPQNQRNIRRATGYVTQFEDPNAPPVAPAMTR